MHVVVSVAYNGVAWKIPDYGLGDGSLFYKVIPEICNRESQPYKKAKRLRSPTTTFGDDILFYKNPLFYPLF